jgi:DNA adenine methylase
MISKSPYLVAPFPYFGGKRRATELVWSRFGDADNYVEPFCGSLAVLLKSPIINRTETVNDLNGFVANFWRAIKADPEGVAKWADWPVSEIDLEARHAWLVNRGERLCWSLGDADYFDAKAAGWWVWGQCAWIGSGWCMGTGSWRSNGVEFFKRDVIVTGTELAGMKRALPHLSNNGMGINRQLPDPEKTDRSQFIRDWCLALSKRLRDVRITCGDWKRTVTPTVTTRHGLTALFLDPPYGSQAVAKGLYQRETGVAAEVVAWCALNGRNPGLRIALCGYDGDYDLPGWTVVCGKATNGGYGSRAGNNNHVRERIWFSPHCLPAPPARRRQVAPAQN